MVVKYKAFNSFAKNIKAGDVIDGYKVVENALVTYDEQNKIVVVVRCVTNKVFIFDINQLVTVSRPFECFNFAAFFSIAGLIGGCLLTLMFFAAVVKWSFVTLF